MSQTDPPAPIQPDKAQTPSRYWQQAAYELAERYTHVILVGRKITKHTCIAALTLAMLCSMPLTPSSNLSGDALGAILFYVSIFLGLGIAAGLAHFMFTRPNLRKVCLYLGSLLIAGAVLALAGEMSRPPGSSEMLNGTSARLSDYLIAAGYLFYSGMLLIVPSMTVERQIPHFSIADVDARAYEMWRAQLRTIEAQKRPASTEPPAQRRPLSRRRR